MHACPVLTIIAKSMMDPQRASWTDVSGPILVLDFD